MTSEFQINPTLMSGAHKVHQTQMW